MTDQFAVVGDIHGNLTALDGLLPQIAQRSETTIFVGDYINRGPNSRGVLDRLIDLSPPAICLLGNHETALLHFIDGGNFQHFLHIGGAPTVQSFIADLPPRNIAATFRGHLAGRYERFLRSLATYHSSAGLLVTHDQHRPSNMNRPLFHVYGHSVQCNGHPRITRHYAAIDTGCGTLDDGRLTCLLWPSLSTIQVDNEGQSISD